MTAEVVTMNKGAAAMAADSAITVIGKKVYNSGSKLFPLSKNHPIGIMFYGNAAMMGVPWETIVAEYRRHVMNTHFSKIEEFGHHFLKFIGESKLLFPAELQKEYLLQIAHLHFSIVVQAVDRRVETVLKQKQEIADDEVTQIVTEEVLKQVANVESAPYVDVADEAYEIATTEILKADLSKVIDDVFKKLPIAGATKDLLLRMAPKTACKRWLFNNLRSGIVICGYGAQQIYPSLFSVEIESVYDGKVRCWAPQVESISNAIHSYIRPFAQQDVAQSFLRGIDPSFRTELDSYFAGLFGGLSDVLLTGTTFDAATTEAIRNRANEIGKGAVEHIKQQLERLSRERFVDPVLGAVQVLPKDELATMAETLVSLTSFRRRMSLDVETVGGPVDVAVISKKDGFIWIKRKHYFSPELNPSFFKDMSGNYGKSET